MKHLNSSNFTLIIPSYERPKYIERLVEYWSNIPINVHILDGSKKSIAETLNLPETGLINYHHLPVSIEERFLFAEGLITTPFSALLSDDEFFLPSALESCIAFLQVNSLYVSCTGCSIGFDWRAQKVTAIHSYPDHRGIDISCDNAFARMEKLMSNYQLICLWAVVRSDVLKASLRGMGSLKASCAGVVEIQNALITVSYGGCKVLDEVLWLRSYENDNQWWSFGRQTFSDWYKDHDRADERVSFLRATVKNMAPFRYGVNDKNVTFENVIEIYLASLNGASRDHPLKQSLDLFKQLLIRPVSRISLFIYRKIFKKVDSFISIEESFSSMKIKYNKTELLQIEKLVKKFHTESIDVSSQ